MLPIYNIQIDLMDEETGCYTISMVESPAVEVDFLAFEQDTPIQLQLNSDKHVVTGIALRADYPIYRNNNRYGEHYVTFTKDTIKQIIEKYSKYGFNNLVNIEHNGDYVNDVVMIESYIIDKENGVNPTMFSEIEDGSWVVTFKVNNLNLWDKIKSGEVKGFSIEGLFRYSEPVTTELKKIDVNTISNEESELDSLVNELIS